MIGRRLQWVASGPEKEWVKVRWLEMVETDGVESGVGGPESLKQQPFLPNQK